MKTLLDLAEWADTMPKRIDTAANKAAVFVSAKVVWNLIHVTPVDTTEALSNWIVSVGFPAYNAIGPLVPGFLGYTATSSQAKAYAAAMAALDKKKPGQAVYIGNNAEHIRLLNDGWSKQEPAGFVERAVLLGRKTASNYKLELKGT